METHQQAEIFQATANIFRHQKENLTANEKAGLQRATQRYMDLAYQYAVQFSRPTIRVECSFRAARKSTIAKELASTLKVKVLQSDIVRQSYSVCNHSRLRTYHLKKESIFADRQIFSFAKTSPFL